MQIKFFTKKKSFKKHGSNFKPGLYWQLIIFVVLILALVSFFFGYYVFVQVNKESILSTENGTKKETVKKERVQKVLEYFSEREEKSNQILVSPSPVVDPSL